MSGVLRMWWVRAILAGLVGEIALIVVVMPFFFLPDQGQPALTYFVPPASFVVFIPFGYWAARTASERRILIGAAAGLFASIFYLALAYGGGAAAGSSEPMPLAYHVANALKILGGGLGGWLAARRAGPAAS